jgi:WD40 repeat protein
MSDDEDEAFNEQLLQNILSSVNDEFNIKDYLIDGMSLYANNNNSNSSSSQQQTYKVMHGEDALLIDELLSQLHYDEKKHEIDDFLFEKKKQHDESVLIQQQQEQEQQLLEQQQLQQIQQEQQTGDLHEFDQQVLNDIDSLLRSSKQSNEPLTGNEISEVIEEEPVVSPSKQVSDQKSEKQKEIDKIRKHFIEFEDLPNLTEYLNRQANRLQKGRPRVFKVCPAYYAVGTSHGIILLFSRQDRKVTQLKLDNSKLFTDVNQYNGVTCMDLTSSGDLILSGYERGQIVLWDTKTKTVVKKFTIAGLLHETKNKSTQYLCIDNICFLHDKMQFVVSCGNALLMITMSKVLFSIYSEVKAILNSNSQFGHIRHIAVLAEGLAPHPTNEFLLIAVATATEILIINLRTTSTFQIPYRLTMPSEAEPTSLPYLAWRRVLPPLHIPVEFDPQSKNNMTEIKAKNPHLAVGWGKIINIFQFYMYREKHSLEMNRVSFMNVTNDVIGVCWLEERVMGIIDSAFNVTVADPFVQTSVQTASIKDISLVFHSRFDRVSQTGEVSQRELLPAYHQSYQEHNGLLYLMGEESITALKVLNWKQRIEALIQTKSWTDSIALALDFYHGREIAVVGLPSDTQYQQLLVGEVIKGMLIEYLDNELLGVSSNSFDNSQQKDEYFETVSTTSYSVVTNDLTIFYS